MTSGCYMHQGYIVPAKSKKDIHSYARKVRLLCNVTGKVDVINVLEHFYQDYDVVPIAELPSVMGFTRSDGVIVIREDVYEGAINGNGRDRFTIAHEIGHAVLHKGFIGGMARESSCNTKIYCNSEWQANEFAGALLLPDEAIWQNQDINFLMETYGVSYECASLRLKKTLK